MNLSIDRDRLLGALSSTSQVAAARGGIAALGGVRLELREGKLILTATNLDIALQVVVEVGGDGAGEVLVPARLLLDIVRAAPPGEVGLSLAGAEGSFVVRWSSGEARLRLLQLDDYPQLSFGLGDSPAKLPGAGLQEAIGQVARAASRDETRPLLTGVHLNVAGSRIDLSATDAYRLAVKSLPYAGDAAFEATVPAQALTELAKVVGQEGVEEVGFGVVERRAVFAAGNVFLSSRLLEGEFPDHNQLLPTDPPVSLELERDGFAAVVRRIVLLAQRSTPLALTLEAGSLTVSTRSPDLGEAQDRLEVDYAGEQLVVGFNPIFLRDGVEAVSAPRLTLKLTNAVRPGVIEAQEEDGATYTYLVMPVRLEE